MKKMIFLALVVFGFFVFACNPLPRASGPSLIVKTCGTGGPSLQQFGEFGSDDGVAELEASGQSFGNPQFVCDKETGAIGLMITSNGDQREVMWASRGSEPRILAKANAAEIELLRPQDLPDGIQIRGIVQDIYALQPGVSTYDKVLALGIGAFIAVEATRAVPLPEAGVARELATTKLAKLSLKLQAAQKSGELEKFLAQMLKEGRITETEANILRSAGKNEKELDGLLSGTSREAKLLTEAGAGRLRFKLQTADFGEVIFPPIPEGVSGLEWVNFPKAYRNGEVRRFILGPLRWEKAVADNAFDSGFAIRAFETNQRDLDALKAQVAELEKRPPVVINNTNNVSASASANSSSSSSSSSVTNVNNRSRFTQSQSQGTRNAVTNAPRFTTAALGDSAVPIKRLAEPVSTQMPAKALMQGGFSRN